MHPVMHKVVGWVQNMLQVWVQQQRLLLVDKATGLLPIFKSFSCVFKLLPLKPSYRAFDVLVGSKFQPMGFMHGACKNLFTILHDQGGLGKEILTKDAESRSCIPLDAPCKLVGCPILEHSSKTEEQLLMLTIRALQSQANRRIEVSTKNYLQLLLQKFGRLQLEVC